MNTIPVDTSIDTSTSTMLRLAGIMEAGGTLGGKANARALRALLAERDEARTQVERLRWALQHIDQHYSNEKQWGHPAAALAQAALAETGGSRPAPVGDDVVERVARAMYHVLFPTACGGWESGCYAKDQWREMARAALAAAQQEPAEREGGMVTCPDCGWGRMPIVAAAPRDGYRYTWTFWDYSSIKLARDGETER